MKKSGKMMMTKVHNESEYVFHLPGTENIIRYDVRHMEFQSIVSGQVKQVTHTHMTFEQFECIFKILLKDFFKKCFSLN